MRISVIGCGYLGAVHAASMAELGHDVVGLDVDRGKIDKLARGTAPFVEADLPELLQKHTGTGRLRFTTDAAEIADAQIHFVGVGTPQLDGRLAADMTYVDQAIDTIIDHAKAPIDGEPVLVAGKSTVPVGTSQALAQRLTGSGKNLILAWNPEFLREGHAVADTLTPDRIVYGLPDDMVMGAAAKALLDECYATALSTGTPLVTANYPTAELVKVAANSYLATKISFINAMAELCDATGGDVTRLAEAIGHDERIGSKFLQAGIGFGGGCLPKDIRAFMARAGELGVDEALTFLREVDTINLRRRDHAVTLAEKAVGGNLEGKRITVLGITFKPGTDDLRDSPALDIAGRLWARGASLSIADPAGGIALKAARPDLNVPGTLQEALADADAVMLLTPWKEYVDLDPWWALPLVQDPIIIDGRNALNPHAWADAGWTYYGMGRSVSAW